MLRSVAAASVLILGLFAPGQAFADTLIEEATAAYERTRYDRALELIEQAEASEGLSREELEELLLLRANIHRRQRDNELLEVALTRLASLDPQRELDHRVHPSIRRVFDRVRENLPGPVRVEASAERVAGGSVLITAAVTDDVAAIVQGFRLHGRASGGPWRDTSEATLSIPVEPVLDAEFWAEAIGPGGAPVATHGSASDPIRLTAAGGAVADADAGRDTQNGNPSDGATGTSGSPGDVGEDDGEDIPAWPFVVGGLALVVAAAVVLGVYFGTQPSDETQLGRPTVGLLEANRGSLVSAPGTLLTFD